MSEALYLEDSYLKECDAVVQSVKDEKFVVLDQTIFYPRGGGQPSDTGKIVLPDGPESSVPVAEFPVVFVGKFEGKISHEIDTSGQETGPIERRIVQWSIEAKASIGNRKLAPGDSVRCVLDWDRRYKLMRMHTAAHVLAATMNKELGVLITGNQLGEEKTRFDFNMSRSEKNDREHARDRNVGRGMEEFDREKFNEIVKKANELLKQDLELKIYNLPREEAFKIPGIVKLAGALPPSIKELRIVEIPGIDLQADAGTHVKNLNEVGQIELLKCDNKGKNNRRIYFTLKK
ncbi:MAG: alanine--tRNA ligase-related protein [Candidatus Hodarchaeales archaeon]|jgi:misacylated tRNA(Ala) deacylase